MTMDMGAMGGGMGMGGGPGAGMGGQGPGGGTVEEEFTKGFSDMAYAALQRQVPDLVKDVITFRVLETKPDAGMGVGCFILNTNGEVFFVPVVVVDNTIKPLDLFYSRRLDRYYPLTPEWLQQAGKSAVGEMGAGVKAPPTLQTDVDIRNLVVPPTTGRYSYASDHGDVAARQCWRAFEALAEKTAAPRLQLLDVLTAAPNAVKVAFARVLKRRTRLLEKAAAVYGATALATALQPRVEKTAETRKEWPRKHDVFVADKGMPLQALKENLDPIDVGPAFSAQKLYGFYVKDKRKGTPRAARKFVESDLALSEPASTGIYRVWMADGTTHEAIVIVNPKRFDADVTHSLSTPFRRSHAPTHSFLVVLPDKRCVTLSHLMASPVLTTSQGQLDDLIKSRTAEPKNGDYGVFLSSGAMSIRAFEPTNVEKVTTSDGNVACRVSYGHTVRLDTRQTPPQSIVQPSGGSITSLGKGWRFLPCEDPYPSSAGGDWEARERKRLRAGDICQTGADVLRAVERELRKSGAEPMEVKMSSDRRLYVGADRTPLTVATALAKVASHYDVSIPDAVAALRHAVARQPGSLWVLPRPKTAADAGSAPPPADPNAPPADPNAMAMQAPPPPSGLDLAIAEQLQQIQMQLQALNDKSTALQQVQQRAQQIDAGGGAAAAPMGAAAMMGGPAPAVGGMPPADPSQGSGVDSMAAPGASMQQQAMPPSGGGMPQQGMPQQGMPQQGMPQQGMPQQGMPQQGMPQQGMAPEPPPPPVMSNESLSAGDIESSINPQFLDQAGALDQDHVFDAAAVASLAKQKNLRGAMLGYSTNLESSLDHLGRMLLLLNLREADLKEAIGNDSYVSTEQNVRDTFKGLGDAILSVNQTTDQVGSMAPGMSTR